METTRNSELIGFRLYSSRLANTNESFVVRTLDEAKDFAAYELEQLSQSIALHFEFKVAELKDMTAGHDGFSVSLGSCTTISIEPVYQDYTTFKE